MAVNLVAFLGFSAQKYDFFVIFPTCYQKSNTYGGNFAAENKKQPLCSKTSNKLYHKPMINFKKYSSIENDFNASYMEMVKTEVPAELEFVVQEKVHGTNVSFLCDGNVVLFAKRTAVIEEEEKFHQKEEFIELFTPKVMSLFNRIKTKYPGVESISVFGEMFGGVYLHKDVAPNHKLSMIQKGVCYSPLHEFYGFDIYLFEEGKNRYLPVDEVNELFDTEDFFYARTLFRGTLENCLSYSNRFESKISEWLGYPAIDDNICEGIVIRPVTPFYLRNGDRVLIKSKNERFSELKMMKNRNKSFVKPKRKFSGELDALLTEVDAFITENRLANVISHIGEVEYPKDFGRVTGMFAKDILEDFNKSFGDRFAALEKAEQKAFTKELNNRATPVVNNYFKK